MKGLFVGRKIKYDGTQLSSHFAYKNFKLAGDSIVAFIGPVEVKLDEMVDIEDVINKEPIYSDLMLNFIIEVFGFELKGLVALQRLFVCIIKETLEAMGKIKLSREGDDLFYDGRKLSVSIATVSPVSGLIHTALNIRNTGCPIPVSCLDEFNIDVKDFTDKVIRNFTAEFEEICFASVKVDWVK
ncbi:MAG: DUF366 family protein [Brevinematia bacterium]